MGAHNAATQHYATERAAWLADRLRDSHSAQPWADTIHKALAQPTGGTIKSRLSEHADKEIETFQAVLKLSGATVVDARGLWAPGARKVTRQGATFVELDDSRRDFKGVTTLTAGDIYVGFSSWGDDAVQMSVYRA